MEKNKMSKQKELEKQLYFPEVQKWRDEDRKEKFAIGIRYLTFLSTMPLSLIIADKLPKTIDKYIESIKPLF